MQILSVYGQIFVSMSLPFLKYNRSIMRPIITIGIISP